MRYPTLGLCAECEAVPASERHHWDGDPFNNEPVNVVPLCHRCHMRLDGRLAKMGTLGVRFQPRTDECPNGHPYTPANTYTGRGRKECRVCRAAACRAYRARQKP